jgi:hypothetical protein
MTRGRFRGRDPLHLPTLVDPPEPDNASITGTGQAPADEHERKRGDSPVWLFRRGQALSKASKRRSREEAANRLLRDDR